MSEKEITTPPTTPDAEPVDVSIARLELNLHNMYFMSGYLQGIGKTDFVNSMNRCIDAFKEAILALKILSGQGQK